MPRVPTYDALGVAINPGQGTAFRAPDAPDTFGRQAQEAGQNLQAAGGQMAKLINAVQQEANEVRVDDAMNQFVKARTDLQVQAVSLRGKNALERPDNKSLPDEFSERLVASADEIGGKLSNPAQVQAFRHQTAQAVNQFRGTLSTHMVEQDRIFRIDTQKSTIETAVNQGVLLWGDPGMREQSMGAITAAVDKLAQYNGWDKVTRDAAMVDAASPLHTGVMKSMIQGGQADVARQYYEANNANMTLQARANLQGVIKDASDAQAAESTADAIWGALGPKDENEPVRLFDMEQEARNRLKNNPDAMKQALQGLRSRKEALNAQQSEMKATNIAGVWKLIDGGVGMAGVRKSEAWMNLTDTERHEFRRSLESEAATRASRGAAEASRELSNMQRSEKMAFMRNGDSYLTLTDPDVLSKMSRAQVEAKRGDFGMEATQHLLAQYDKLQKPGKIIEARMDKEDFDQVADSLGLKPFSRNLGESDKRALGTLKYRVEQMIDVAQASKKEALTRQEKQDLMRREMARTVTLPGWGPEWGPEWAGSSSKTVPVIQLTPDQLRKVAVPTTERSQIVDALRTMNQREPSNPAYFPTEDNVRRLYARKVSPAAGLISNGQ